MFILEVMKLSLFGNQHDFVASVEQLVRRVVGDANCSVVVHSDLFLVLFFDDLSELVGLAFELIVASEARKCPVKANGALEEIHAKSGQKLDQCPLT